MDDNKQLTIAAVCICGMHCNQHYSGTCAPSTALSIFLPVSERHVVCLTFPLSTVFVCMYVIFIFLRLPLLLLKEFWEC